MKCRKSRLIAVICLILAHSILVLTTSPAYGASLSGITAGTKNPFTSAVNAQYDWSFTTATTATLSRATMGVPSGTDCDAERYLALRGVGGNYASTPDSAANSITGDIDIRVKAQLVDWTPSTINALLSKRSGTFSYQLRVESAGQLVLFWNDGASKFATTAVGTGFTDGTANWVRVALDVNTGSGWQATFYTSADGSSWSQLAAPTGAPVTSIVDTAEAVEVGSGWGGGTYVTNGNIYHAEIRNGIDGPVVNNFDGSQPGPASATSWAASTGETWTINRTGSNLPADLTCPLAVAGASGIPAGGTATLRLIDQKAFYVFTPTSVPSGTAATLQLSGFTNTATPGSSTSLITTFDNTPATVDSATASAFSFFTASLPNLSNSSLALTDPGRLASSKYTFTASGVTTSTTRCFKVNFSTGVNQSGVKPVGMNLSGASLDATSTWTASPASWTTSVDNTSGTVTLTYATGATPASSSARTLVLNGITNPGISGTYYALVNSYQNVDCATGPLDSTTVAFDVHEGIVFSATIDPALTFTVGAHVGACNGVAQSAGVSVTGNSIGLGHLGPGQTLTAAQDLSITTNSTDGYSLYLRSNGPLTSGVNTIANVPGSNANPGAFPSGTPAFGYTTDDSSLGTGDPDRFTNPSAAWAAASTSNAEVAFSSTGYVSEVTCVAYQVGIDNTVKPGSFSATVIYTVVPTY